MWRVVVPMEQRESGYSAFEPRYSKGTDGGRDRKGGEGHFQLGKGGARRETDLAVVVLASACSPGSQPALRSARAIPRSRDGLRRLQRRVHRDLGTFLAFSSDLGLFFRSHHPGAGWLNRKCCAISCKTRSISIKRDLEAETKHIEVSCQKSNY